MADRRACLLALVAGLAALLPLPASARDGPLGIVIMHGKGGSPEGLVAGLAATLEANGYLVANIEMPWSGSRQYDVPVLFIVPTRDYPGLLRTSPRIYRLLPRHPRTRLYEPEAGHGDAPTASAAEIMRWTRAVAAAAAPR